MSKESDLSSSASKDSGYNVDKEGKKADVIELSHTNHKIVLLNDKQRVVVEDFPEEVASTSSDTSCTDDKVLSDEKKRKKEKIQLFCVKYRNVEISKVF